MPFSAHLMIRCFIVTCFLALSLAQARVIQAKEPSPTAVVISVGTSTIYNDDVASARNHAISNSLVSAISQIISGLLSHDTLTADFQVLNTILYSRTRDYIQGYKVLNSSRYGKQFSVIVEATVLTGVVEEQLSSVGLQLFKHKFPIVLFFMIEQDLSDPQPKYWWKDKSGFLTFYAENMMSVAMKDNGFFVMDHRELYQDKVMSTLQRPDLNKQEVITLGAHFKADVVIMGTAVAHITPNKMGNTTGSYKGEVVARAFRTDTGAQMGLTQESFVTADEDALAGGTNALSGAGRLAGIDLSNQISKAWLVKMKILTGIGIYIKWDGNLAHLVELRKALTALPGVMAISPREMSMVEVIIGVDYKGSEKELAEALITHRFSSFGIHIYEISDRHLSIAILPI